MRINSINNINVNQNYHRNQKPVRRDVPEIQSDTVNFKGVKNAIKGFGIVGALGAAVGAICSGGALIPAMLLFGTCNGIVGAAIGANVDDD